MNITKILPLLILTLFPGCLNLSQTIKDLPGYEFGDLNYARTGNITSTTVNAQNAKIEDDVLTIESVDVVHSNPFFGINVSVKNLKRPAAKNDAK
jgi:hypothetical protein